MTPKKIDEVERLADRFLEKLLKVKQTYRNSGIGPDTTLWGDKYTGALRRASMDLTRALAEMRRPGRSWNSNLSHR